jgi:hypothetical protein
MIWGNRHYSKGRGLSHIYMDIQDTNTTTYGMTYIYSYYTYLTYSNLQRTSSSPSYRETLASDDCSSWVLSLTCPYSMAAIGSLDLPLGTYVHDRKPEINSTYVMDCYIYRRRGRPIEPPDRDRVGPVCGTPTRS